jgi:NAD(P)-dependent dehydrogenase (short-subunit alcohol dehydrogenase family)
VSWHPDLLAGQAAVVAGGGRGIGAAVARALAGAGAAVCVIDVEIERASDVVAAIAAAGGHAIAVQAELRDAPQVDAAINHAAAAFGGVNVLVNVAGGMHAYAPWRRLADWDEDTWDEIMDRNLRYVFLTTRAMVRQLLAAGTGGSVVNIASISGETSAPNHTAYGAAKAGLTNLTRTLAVEYGPEQIRFNAVAPGSVATPAVADRVNSTTSAPLQRWATPEDIANAVVFLASPLASYITGQTLLVDGGASANFPLTTPTPIAPVNQSR